jgi:hypothetical protein
MLANKRNAGAVLLKIDAIFDAVNLEINVSADRWIEFGHDYLAAESLDALADSFSISRRISSMRVSAQ